MTHIVEPYYLFKKPQNFSLMILTLDPLAIHRAHRLCFSPRSDKRSCVFDAVARCKNYYIACSRRIVPRSKLYRISLPYQSSCFVAGSTFFRSACAGAGPIFQRIIRIPLSRGPNVPRDAFQPFPSGLSGWISLQRVSRPPK